MTHSWVTIAVPMESARTAATRAALRKMDNPARPDVREALRHDLKIHFMSTGVIEGDPGQPSYLVFEISSDLAPDATIALVARVLAPWYGPVLAAAGIKGELAATLKAHHIRTGQGLLDHPGLDHTGSPGMSVKRIRDEWDLARGIRDLFDTRSYAGTPLEILEQVRADVRAGDDFKALQHLLVPEPTPCLLEPPPKQPVAALIAGLVVPGILTFLWPVLVPALLLAAIATGIVWNAGAETAVVVLVALTGLGLVVLTILAALFVIYAGLRRREAADVPDNSLPDDAVLAEIYADENKAAQNHMTGVSRMKPGHLRRLTLRLAFWFIGQVARRQYRPGFLGALGTIHFARWVLLPGTDKLVFFSNYGGSWESYLEDFITKAHAGLTGVWSNTEGYPRASNLFGDGATDGDRFKRWARRQQQPTPFWYSAYPHVTTARIRANASIRQGLTSASTREEAELWLAQLGSRTPPPTLLETREIQTLLFGGLKHHPHAVLLAVSAPADAASAKALLAAVKPLVGFGDQPDPKCVAMLALGAGALAKAGLSAEGLASFPFAFRDGMASAVRSKILSDTGDDKPAHWLWGAGDADAVLVIYGATPAVLKSVEAEATAVLTRHGGRVVHRVALRDLDSAAQASGRGLKNQEHEAFGFADGVSQPLIKGARRWKATRDRIHEVEPGEFILGYPDNRGFQPLSPVVPSETDPANHLATIAPPPPGGFAPDLSNSHANLDRDLGRNGTYLVVRQLAQDTQAFDASLKVLADAAKDHPGAPPGLTPAQLQHWIAAKMVGRWKDGTSLVRYPHRPGTGWNGEHPHIEPDNDFLLGAEDPVGQRCPFGSHIRRTNPRESFEPGSMEQLAIVNRHRILRAGRRYEGYSPGKGARKEQGGLMFMCFNADLERQFEFVQQTWAMAPQFHGLENEVDAILGRGKTTGRLTIPTASGPLQVKGLADVVRVRGGGYFFVPSKSALDYLST